MFYQPEPSRVLRFGDVIQGFVLAELNLKKPLFDLRESNYEYNIQISFPKYCVILTPCCSIESSVISLCPLEQVKGNFLKNERFKANLSMINRRMPPKDALSNEDWSAKPPEEQANILGQQDMFVLLQHFIYEPNDLFPKYSLRGNEIGHYAIDFKNSFRIKCDLIRRSNSVDEILLRSKLLELSIDSRYELREKIANFYSRVPEEDLVEQR